MSTVMQFTTVGTLPVNGDFECRLISKLAEIKSKQGPCSRSLLVQFPCGYEPYELSEKVRCQTLWKSRLETPNFQEEGGGSPKTPNFMDNCDLQGPGNLCPISVMDVRAMDRTKWNACLYFLRLHSFSDAQPVVQNLHTDRGSIGRKP